MIDVRLGTFRSGRHRLGMPAYGGEADQNRRCFRSPPMTEEDTGLAAETSVLALVADISCRCVCLLVVNRQPDITGITRKHKRILL